MSILSGFQAIFHRFLGILYWLDLILADRIKETEIKLLMLFTPCKLESPVESDLNSEVRLDEMSGQMR